MCGIIGYTGMRAAMDTLLAGLGVLAYRGYDSAGVAVVSDTGIDRCRAAGKIENLIKKVQGEAVYQGTCGIGHTRWATHGAPTEENAHPHTDAAGRVAVVHNGIIENERELRQSLEAHGVRFTSETDTEVVPHLLMRNLAQCGEIHTAIRRTVAVLRGSYALAMVFSAEPYTVYAVRRHSPMVVAEAEDGCYLASDVTALLSHSRRVAYPEEGELVRMTPTSITLYDGDEKPYSPRYTSVTWETQAAGRGGYRHYMEKELCEVPCAIEATLAAVRAGAGPFKTVVTPSQLAGMRELLFLGCGSAYHAGLLASALCEETAGIRAHAEIASEYRYRAAVTVPHTLAVAISQSGETADTLAALEEAQVRGCESLGIVNVPSSAIARAADHVFYTQAGPEIAVATTKAYCAQVVAAWGLAAALLAAHGEEQASKALLEEMSSLTKNCREILASRGEIATLSSDIAKQHDVFFIGRGADAAVCREGALKLKEITYLHAEAFDAGELKHGTISLIEQNTPVIAVMTQPRLAGQMISNIREVMARGAAVTVIAAAEAKDIPTSCRIYRLPRGISPRVAPLAAAYVLQWLSYEVCLRVGVEPDMPRNLAKSVTVE